MFHPGTESDKQMTYGYSASYRVGAPFRKLQELFPNLGSYQGIAIDEVAPEGSDGYFFIPRFEKLDPSYPAALVKLFDGLQRATRGRFHNFLDQYSWHDRIRPFVNSTDRPDLLAKQGNEHGHLFGAQLGLRHRGRSVEQVRAQLTEYELGLGTYAVGMAILGQLDRLNDPHSLWIDCPGDQYLFDHDHSIYASAPYYAFNDGWLTLSARTVHAEDRGFGSATALLSRSV